jgi:hypothetical protein
MLKSVTYYGVASFLDINDGEIYYYNKNGYRYQGEMKNNMREGFGIGRSNYLKRSYTPCRYEGNWKNNKREGRGTLIYDCPITFNNHKHEGDFKSQNDKKDIYMYDDEWKNGKRCSFGKMNFYFMVHLQH